MLSKNKDGYDSWSSIYDEYPNPTVAIDEMFFPKHWQHLTNVDVLEIGCGTGRHTQKLVRQGNRVVGLDMSSGMLNVAAERLKDTSVKLIEANFLEYEGLGDQKFDVMVTSLVIEHISNLKKFFSKVQAVLKPNGLFFVSDIHPQKSAKGSRANFVEPTTGQSIYLESYPHTDEDVVAAAKTANLALIRSEDVLGNEALAAINPEWHRYLGMPMVKIWVFKYEAFT